MKWKSSVHVGRLTYEHLCRRVCARTHRCEARADRSFHYEVRLVGRQRECAGWGSVFDRVCCGQRCSLNLCVMETCGTFGLCGPRRGRCRHRRALASLTSHIWTIRLNLGVLLCLGSRDVRTHTLSSPFLCLFHTHSSSSPIRGRMSVIRVESWWSTAPYYSPPTAGQTPQRTFCAHTHTHNVFHSTFYFLTALFWNKNKERGWGLPLPQHSDTSPTLSLTLFVFSASLPPHLVSPQPKTPRK